MNRQLQVIRVDILLPRFYNPDSSGNPKKIEPRKIDQTLDEIENTFGGYTLNDIPIIGSWINPKTKKSMKDSHRSIWVSAEYKPDNVEKFRKFKETWKERFEQEDIAMYFITIDTL